MRFIIHGVGAIGGTIAVSLATAGREVIGIARGEQLKAINAKGLTLRTPRGTETCRFECVESPSAIVLRPDDVVLVCTKTQHMGAVIVQLAAAGFEDQAIFCFQNGVENERSALRHFAHVHGVSVIMPADYVTPGEVVAFGSPHSGYFYLGRYPHGSDSVDEAVANTLTASGLPAFIVPDVMKIKYGKLLLNLSNIVNAACGGQGDTAPITDILRREAETVFTASGIKWQGVGETDPNRGKLMKIASIAGFSRAGSSSAQSLARSTGSIETDYLNGEVVLLGRLHGVPTPANAWFCEIAARMVREKLQPGIIPLDEVKRALSIA
jgi:2-dehydropantoate 2-reductase